MLGQRLRRLGYAEAPVRRALDKAEHLGYLNDQAYAEALARRRSRSRGRALITQELRAKGIPPSAAAEVLDEIGEGEPDTAFRLAREMMRRKPPSDTEDLRRRVGSMLSRRGFGTALVRRVCAELGRELRLAQRFDTLCEVD